MKSILSKLSYSFLLITGIWVLNFSLLYLSPGDTTSRYWGPDVKQEVLQQMRVEKGLNLPYHQQLMLWTGRLLQGDLGYSWKYHRPVWDIFREAMPATFQLAFLALMLNIVLGCFFGIVAAILATRKSGLLLDTGSLVLYSIPTFWLAMVAVYVFSLKLNWLPGSGMRALFPDDTGLLGEIVDRIRHIILPATLLGIAGAVATMRYVRGQMIDILRQPYILMAYAKGLSKTKVILRHAFRNALLPVITQLGLYFPFLLGGAFVIEVIFAWPGMGRVAYEAIFAKDYPVILAANFLTACAVIGGNLLADLLYRVVDPRVRVP